MKIISYAIFGEEDFYRIGLKKNIEIARYLFDDWVLQIRVSDKIDKSYIKSLESSNTDIFVVADDNCKMGRMLPMETNNEAVIVRDIDTRLMDRDRKLVDDWINSKYKFHICRDNPGSEQPILGGLYGGKYPNLGIQKYWNKWILEKEQQSFVWDMGFLKRYVYPQIKNDLIVYTENIFYNKEVVRKIPGERGFFDGRKKMLGMYCSEDLVPSDDIKNKKYKDFFGKYKNQQRKEMIEFEKKFDFTEKKYFVQKYMFINSYLNFLYLLFDFLLFRLIFFRKYKSHIFLLEIIKRKLFFRNKQKNEVTIYK
jgi:hypothetical protein